MDPGGGGFQRFGLGTRFLKLSIYLQSRKRRVKSDTSEVNFASVLHYPYPLPPTRVFLSEQDKENEIRFAVKRNHNFAYNKVSINLNMNWIMFVQREGMSGE